MEAETLEPRLGSDDGSGQGPSPNSAALVGGLRTYFSSGTTSSLSWRRQQLRQLRKMLVENESRFLQALREDLNKAPQEGFMTEVSATCGDIDHALKRLKNWVKPRRVSTPLVAQPGRSYVQPEPLGVVLIIGAWNYPLQLLLSPLVPAIAAGNCAVIKPSEMAPATSALVAGLLSRYLDSDAFACVEGGVPETTDLLEQRWDHILYTGGGRVGKIVMQAAARHLTPVTLELGGKSPCIVADDADITVTARRIAWGKFTNAGQTCIAPDYVLCTRATAERLVPAIEAEVRSMFGEDPRQSPDYGRIVNRRHTERLAAYVAEGNVAWGGQVDIADRYVAPTLLRGTGIDAKVMQEEIFGPVLPVIELDDFREAEDFVNRREKPLALYVFSDDSATADRILARCSSGNACVNDCMMFMAVHELPFGGVGQSGMGAYHGEHGFRTFSHYKAVMKRGYAFDLDLRYAPFTARKFKLLRWLR
ncbi:aldehyde dehydrogenase family protein [Microbulbifer sp. YPW16]|uniref:aldehyde dehydrogenase family protein n=1 Tax=Microbulbifer sp. YPW16 TaxID=2904242 RepID=UPI001E5B7F4E|nr:aldehyde dehydrogenase family protein [Microbulbifer sp. YPW16]UHQ56272.1 aldehyde dehydrogenase family protein [Microbulbifer sp. YPW16]